MELGADMIGSGRTNLCPGCRRDLTTQVRAHLFRCVTLPAEIRQKAQEVREAAQRLIKWSQELSDRSDVLIREAEALLLERQKALRTVMARRTATIRWLRKPQDHDYAAALSYLTLIAEAKVAKQLVKQLRRAPMAEFKAKDIFRASGLSLLGISNSHIEKDNQKIAARVALSPLLLVRDVEHGKLVIADGYHRLCAVYRHDEDAVIPSKIV